LIQPLSIYVLNV